MTGGQCSAEGVGKQWLLMVRGVVGVSHLIARGMRRGVDAVDCRCVGTVDEAHVGAVMEVAGKVGGGLGPRHCGLDPCVTSPVVPVPSLPPPRRVRQPVVRMTSHFSILTLPSFLPVV